MSAAAGVAVAGAALFVETAATATVTFPMIAKRSPRSAIEEGDALLDRVSTLLYEKGPVMDAAEFRQLKTTFAMLHEESKQLPKKKTKLSFLPFSSYRSAAVKYRDDCWALSKETTKTSVNAKLRLIEGVIPYSPPVLTRKHSMDTRRRTASVTNSTASTMLGEETQNKFYHGSVDSPLLSNATGASSSEALDGVELQSMPSPSPPTTPPSARERWGRVRQDTDVDFA